MTNNWTANPQSIELSKQTKEMNYVKRLFFLLLSIPTFLHAQDETGIKWTTGLSWEQVKQKAKQENKYIFVDAYATWCGPCKKMDKEVYINDSVGDAVNPNFIAVKVQMDSSKLDNQQIRSWYNDVHAIKQEFKIHGYPTFLFLSPEGNLVHKGSGYKNVSKFIAFATEALDPKTQFYSLVRKYEVGEFDYATLPNLAITALSLKEEVLAREIALNYINNYLLKMKKKELFKKENIKFIMTFTTSTSEKGFSLLYHNRDKLNDTVYLPGFLSSVINDEFVEPVLAAYAKQKTIDPDWDKLQRSIDAKFTPYFSERVIIAAKTRWYAAKKRWPEYCENTVAYIERFGANYDDISLAIDSWNIFLHSTNQNELKTALSWTEKVMNRTVDSTNVLPNIMDTHANILHKLSYLFRNKAISRDAIEIEEKALAIVKKFNLQDKESEFQVVREKMRNGQPTWPAE